MNANNEEYLDSLLNSAKSSDNPQSALSRMATKGGKNSSTSQRNSGAGDIGALVDNSNGENEALNDIGSLLDRLDRDEIIDLDKCVEVTNIINPLLDEADLIKESYTLDVSTKEKGRIENE